MWWILLCICFVLLLVTVVVIADNLIFKRLIAFAIDLSSVALLGILLLYIVIGIRMISKIMLLVTIIEALLLTLVFCRDIFTGRSLGRRICGLSVVDADSFHPVSEFRALVRNLFIVVWPIELVVLFLKKRRLGDIVTHTDVVEGNITRRVTWVGILLFMAVWTILFVMLYIVYQNPLIRLMYQ